MGDLENSGRETGGLRLDDRSPPSFLPLQTLRLQFHHICVVVGAMDDALDHYVGLLGFERVGPLIDVAAERTRVGFIRAEPGVLFGLIESTGNPSLVDLIRGLPGQPTTYVCYQVDDLEAAVGSLCDRDCLLHKRYELLAQGMRHFALLSAPDGQLFELCEFESDEEVSS